MKTFIALLAVLAATISVLVIALSAWDWDLGEVILGVWVALYAIPEAVKLVLEARDAQ